MIERSAAADNMFSALADPTRRTIIELLVSEGSSTATVLAGDLTISRQATSKHLNHLEASGLAVSQKVGRETLYTLNPGPLNAVSEWVGRVEGEWQARLQLLAKSLDDDQTLD